MSSGVSFHGNESRTYDHGYTFDPAHGFHPNALLDIEPPPEPSDFRRFWETYYERVRDHDPRPEMRASPLSVPRGKVYDVFYTAHDGIRLHAWLTLPGTRKIRRGYVNGHGYGGRTAPDSWLPSDDAAGFFPSARGISTSRCPQIPENPHEHVLHGIHARDEYILGRCAADFWTATTVLGMLVPEATGRIDFVGVSFGGGVGMLALPWDERLTGAHLRVPSFGHYPFRLRLPCTGSGRAVSEHVARNPEAVDLLRYFDAAIAAKHVRVPIHVAAALFDPVVPPAGQFAIYNAIPGDKELFILHAGHFDHPEERHDIVTLHEVLEQFFADKSP